MLDSHWRPSASLAALKLRATMLAKIRQFFAARDVLEVETPLMSRYSVTDPHMEVITTANPHHATDEYFLQTSPEYAMKRLLAAGSGSIYQICKSFRQGEAGSRHNPEFSMLEWYRPGFDHRQLMDEVEELVCSVLNTRGCQRLSYRQIFEEALGIDPHSASCEQLKVIAREHVDIQMSSDRRDDWLNLLLAEVIEPTLGSDAPVFIYDYPASQAALARLAKNEAGVLVARRFELYYRGVELANGYFELTDPKEQRERFQQDQKLRTEMGKPAREFDPHLLAAMEQGLPSCAGVALGLDRLLMLHLGASHIEEVLAFSVDRA
jgi:lysyl-tRNA synthetase class 2